MAISTWVLLRKYPLRTLRLGGNSVFRRSMCLPVFFYILILCVDPLTYVRMTVCPVRSNRLRQRIFRQATMSSMRTM
jgi:hypothetical protein